jgi:hypothetical protein
MVAESVFACESKRDTVLVRCIRWKRYKWLPGVIQSLVRHSIVLSNKMKKKEEAYTPPLLASARQPRTDKQDVCYTRRSKEEDDQNDPCR